MAGEHPGTTTLTLSLRGRLGATDRSELVALDARFCERYVLGNEIGRGAMGAVFHALHRPTARPVAVKVLTALQPDMLARFLREGQLQARIEHGNVVRLFDLDTVGENPYLAMELVEGGSLRSLLDQRGRLPAAETMDLMAECLDGLAACHAAGIVHRDFKPDNVLLTADGQPKIADLGLAFYFLEAQRVTSTGALVGTPRYMAPEQVKGEEPTRATDVYAAGAVLFEMLAGRPLVESPGMKDALREILTAPVPDLRVHAPGAPRALVQLVEKALARDPEKRPADAAELLAELDLCRAPASGVTAASVESDPGPARTPVVSPRSRGGQTTDPRAVSAIGFWSRPRTVALAIWLTGVVGFGGWMAHSRAGRPPPPPPVEEGVRPEQFAELLGRLRSVAGRQRELAQRLVAADRRARVMTKEEDVRAVHADAELLRSMLEALSPDLQALEAASSAPPAVRALLATAAALAEVARDRLEQVGTWVSMEEQARGRFGLSALSNVDFLPSRAVELKARGVEAAARAMDLTAEWAQGAGAPGDLPGCLADLVGSLHDLSLLMGRPRFPAAAGRAFDLSSRRAKEALASAPPSSGADVVLLAWVAGRAEDAEDPGAPAAKLARDRLLARLAELEHALPAEAGRLSEVRRQLLAPR